MTLLILSFLAGVLTVAAPCILPLLPVVVGKSLVPDGHTKEAKQRFETRPLVITASLVVSIILFTLLLKATTALLGIPAEVWQIISGAIIVLLGLNFLLPELWKKIPIVSRTYIAANTTVGRQHAKSGYTSDIVTGAALGPIFNSCSPTYAFVVAAVLPSSFLQGLTYLSSYAVGVGAALLAIAYVGQTVISKLGWVANPNSLFIKIIAIILILVGVSLIFGLDKLFQEFVLKQGWYDPILRLEQSIGHQ